MKYQLQGLDENGQYDPSLFGTDSTEFDSRVEAIEAANELISAWEMSGEDMTGFEWRIEEIQDED